MSKIETIVTWLEMKAPPAHAPIVRDDLQVSRVRPTVRFYRFLYDGVGGPWLWIDRKRIDDAALAQIIEDDAVEVWVAWSGGVPVGYFELDRRAPPEIELAYFGLFPEWSGKKIGPWLLDRAIRTAWSYSPSRFWVHTQTLDDPRALPLYEKLGFVRYKQHPHTIEITS
jgi:GNAT superfamily N-acetyltransferase